MNNLWQKLGPRERRLAVGVVVALAFFVTMTTFLRASRALTQLDSTIDKLELDLRTYTDLEARRVSVEQAYAVVAQQHSSEWTEAEIHNRLRQEIYRLARQNPDAPPDNQKNLVEIPILHQGVLRNSGHGYREYKLNVNVPPAPLESIIEFLMRLQASPQSLRIDGLELAREPQGKLVSARMEVMRTVVDGVGQSGDVAAAAPEPEAGETWEGGVLDQWKANGCDLSNVDDMKGVAARAGCLKAVATKDGAEFWMTADLELPGTYEVVVDVLATGAAELRVKNEGTDSFLEGSTPIMVGEGLSYRYNCRFTVGSEGGPLKLQAPHITLAKAGGEVYVDTVTLRKVSE